MSQDGQRQSGEDLEVEGGPDMRYVRRIFFQNWVFFNVIV